MSKITTVAVSASMVLLASSAYAACPVFGHPGHAPHDRSGTLAVPFGGGFVRAGGFVAEPDSGPDIIDIATAAGSFGTLVEVVRAAGLTETLRGDGPFTLFAPTDAAFARLPPGTLESLLANPDKLAQLLKYHVVPGRLDANAVSSMSRLATVKGEALAVSDIRIAGTDIATANGIIHVVDDVLIPKS